MDVKLSSKFVEAWLLLSAWEIPALPVHCSLATDFYSPQQIRSLVPFIYLTKDTKECF